MGISKGEVRLWRITGSVLVMAGMYGTLDGGLKVAGVANGMEDMSRIVLYPRDPETDEIRERITRDSGDRRVRGGDVLELVFAPWEVMGGAFLISLAEREKRRAEREG